MDTKDLRIGNFIKNKTGECTVHSISKLELYIALGIHSLDESFDKTLPFRKSDIEEYEPIILTEEWLKKLCFYEGAEHYYINVSNNEERPLKILITISESYYYISLWDEADEIVIFEGKKYYVHQLQNLFFAHKGEELILIK